jgi:amino acid transporter
LARRLGTADAVVIELGSMIGAGIFVALGPAAHAAGSGLLIGLAVATLAAIADVRSAIGFSSFGVLIYRAAVIGVGIAAYGLRRAGSAARQRQFQSARPHGRD